VVFLVVGTTFSNFTGSGAGSGDGAGAGCS